MEVVSEVRRAIPRGRYSLLFFVIFGRSELAVSESCQRD